MNKRRKKRRGKEFSFSVFKYLKVAKEHQVWHHKQTSFCISDTVYCPQAVHKPPFHKTCADFITRKSLRMYSVLSKPALKELHYQKVIWKCTSTEFNLLLHFAFNADETWSRLASLCESNLLFIIGKQFHFRRNTHTHMHK